MTPIPPQINQQQQQQAIPVMMPQQMPQQMPYHTMQSIQPMPMNTQQMLYGNPYATGSIPAAFNPQMQQNQMNPQMINHQIYMNSQNSYQVKFFF